MPLTVEVKTRAELRFPVAIVPCANKAILHVTVIDLRGDELNDIIVRLQRPGSTAEATSADGGLVAFVFSKDADESIPIDRWNLLPEAEDVDHYFRFQGRKPNSIRWNHTTLVTLILLRKIFVIGAGAAGLKAAEHLLANNYKVVLCEATERVGGRAYTAGSIGDFKVDLGCQWLHRSDWKLELAAQEDWSDAGISFKEDNQRQATPKLTEFVGTYDAVIPQIISKYNTYVLQILKPAEFKGEFNREEHNDVRADTLLADFNNQGDASQICDSIFDDSDLTEADRPEFNAICAKAYQLERATQGPLEESAEYDQFSNIDLTPERSCEIAEPLGRVEDDFEWGNFWCNLGYGGLIKSYADFLKAQYPDNFKLRTGTPVQRVSYGSDRDPVITTEAAECTASAVVITVSSGVITGNDFELAGEDADRVMGHYTLLPMGNYKKVVLHFDREVLAAQVEDDTADDDSQDAGGSQDDEESQTGGDSQSDEWSEDGDQPQPVYESEGTSVYWHLQDDEKLWKFLVPDSNRSIVITIVGGALADELDESKKIALTRTKAALVQIGLINDEFGVTEPSFVSTWKTDQCFKGAYSYTAPGGKNARKSLMDQPLQESFVYLAGEALFVEYGTAHGAYVSGWRAAIGICNKIDSL